jgi:ribosomal protein L40E
MPALAATATSHAAASGLLLLALTIVTLGYVLACWLWPFVACRRCSGTGKLRALFGGRAFGICRRCDGTGRQLRPGRRALNHLRTVRANDRNRTGGTR